jgi:leucyl-tRNA synthetase
VRADAPTEADDQIRRSTARLIDAVTRDFERWSYHTAVAHLMAYVNELYRYVQSPDGPHAEPLAEGIDTVLKLLAPAAPHLAAELWELRHPGEHVHQLPWPEADADLLTVEEIELPVQVAGKVRARITVPVDADAAALEAAALAEPRIIELLNGSPPSKVIAVPGRLVNVVP